MIADFAVGLGFLMQYRGLVYPVILAQIDSQYLFAVGSQGPDSYTQTHFSNGGLKYEARGQQSLGVTSGFAGSQRLSEAQSLRATTYPINKTLSKYGTSLPVTKLLSPCPSKDS